jgi:hypothetical protein
MRASKSWSFLLVLAALLALAACGRDATPTPAPYVMAEVLEGSVYVRTGPGTGYQVAGQKAKGARLEIVGRNPDGGWWQVCCVRGQPVWIAGRLVKVDGDASGVEVVEDIAPPPTPTPTPEEPEATPTRAGPPTATPIPLMADAALLAGEHGVTILDATGWFLMDHQLGLISERVTDVTLDTEGRLWVAGDAGVSVFNGRMWTNYRLGVFGDSCEELAFDADGGAWVVHSRGASVLSGGQWTHYDGQDLGLGEEYLVARDVVVDAQGSVWVATTSGISVFDGERWAPVGEDSGLITQSAQALAVGPDGRMWVGHGSGVSVYDGGRWINYGAHTDADVKGGPVGVVALAVTAGGSPWAVTWSGEAAHLEGNAWTVYDSSNSGLVGGRGTAIAIDPQGRVWIGTEWHLTVYDGREWISYTPANSGLTPDGVNAIAFSGHGPPDLSQPSE